MDKVKFYSGTQEQYNNLSNKDSNAFYKTTDEKNLYLGESKLTHKEATTTTSGLLSASDKKKLDSIESGANKTIIDSALSSTSTNPVQNKVVNTALQKKATLEKWTCPVEVDTWSRVCNITNYSVGVLTVGFSQNSQTLVYKYCIGTGYNSAFISQVASSGFKANSDIGVRITRDRSVTSYFVEILNNFGYDDATSVNAFLSYEKLDNSTGVLTGFEKFNATDLNSIVITSIVSKPDGIVSPKFYGDLIGNADSATTATSAEKLGSSTVGSNKSLWYLKEGVPTVSSISVGGIDTPTYLLNGAITPCSATFITKANYSSYIPTIYSGTGTPSSSTGKNGDVYFKYS